MKFIADNLIFVFSAISLVGLVFAASGTARTSIFPPTPKDQDLKKNL